MQYLKEDRSLGDLFSELSNGLSTILRLEMDLFKSEVSGKITRTIKDIAYLAIGGAVVYAGFLAIMGMLIALLSTVMKVWIAALIVGAAVLGIGFFLIKKGQAELKQRDYKPRQTIETLKEDKEWIKREI